MNNQKKILILNTGGTFNKYYEPISGELRVTNDNHFIENIISKAFKSTNKVNLLGLIYKDSLELTKSDRIKLVKHINSRDEKKIIIIHGTDTMDITAKYLNKYISNKQIVLVGSMKPYSIEPVEAVSNLMIGYGFLQSNQKNDIFVSMHGYVKKYSKIKKNRIKGVFECQS